MINAIRTTAAAATAAGLMSFAQAAPLQPIPDDQTVRNVVLVHGAFADGSGWRGVYDELTARGYSVTIVQNPLTSLADDVSATIRALDRQDGPAILVGHSWGGTVITEAGVHSNVAGLVYVSALSPDAARLEPTLAMANAAPHTTAAGTFTQTAITGLEVSQAGPNTILQQTSIGSVSGTLSGSYTDDLRVVIHPNGRFNDWNPRVQCP